MAASGSRQSDIAQEAKRLYAGMADRQGQGGLAEPIIEPETERLEMASEARGAPARASLPRWAAPWRRLPSRSLVALPVVLTILYLPSFVHPVSTLMLKDLVTLAGL